MQSEYSGPFTSSMPAYLGCSDIHLYVKPCNQTTLGQSPRPCRHVWVVQTSTHTLNNAIRVRCVIHLVHAGIYQIFTYTLNNAIKILLAHSPRPCRHGWVVQTLTHTFNHAIKVLWVIHNGIMWLFRYSCLR